MEAALLAWLDRTGSMLLWWSLATLVLVDLAAVVVVAATRDRTVVNRWTGRMLAVNLMLLGTATGGLAVSFAGPFVVSTVASLLPSSSWTSHSAAEEPAGER